MKVRKKRFDDLETFLTSIVMGLIWGMAALISLRKRWRWIKG